MSSFTPAKKSSKRVTIQDSHEGDAPEIVPVDVPATLVHSPMQEWSPTSLRDPCVVVVYGRPDQNPQEAVHHICRTLAHKSVINAFLNLTVHAKPYEGGNAWPTNATLMLNRTSMPMGAVVEPVPDESGRVPERTREQTLAYVMNKVMEFQRSRTMGSKAIPSRLAICVNIGQHNELLGCSALRELIENAKTWNVMLFLVVTPATSIPTMLCHYIHTWMMCKHFTDSMPGAMMGTMLSKEEAKMASKELIPLFPKDAYVVMETDRAPDVPIQYYVPSLMAPRTIMPAHMRHHVGEWSGACTWNEPHAPVSIDIDLMNELCAAINLRAQA
jgi:hypothetical protein